MSEYYENDYEIVGSNVLRHVCEQTLRKNFYVHSHKGVGVPFMNNLISSGEEYGRFDGYHKGGCSFN